MISQPVPYAPIWAPDTGAAYAWPRSGPTYAGPTRVVAAPRAGGPPRPAPFPSPPLAAASVVALAVIGYGVGRRFSRDRRTRAVQLNARWPDEPILDESIPDPIFDGKGQERYTGRGYFGFNRDNELLNGRLAMMGFFVVYLQELFAGKGVLQQYGIPLDSGAVPQDVEGFVLPPIVAVVFAFILVAGGVYGGVVLADKFKDETKRPPLIEGNKPFELPFEDKLPKL